MNGDLIALALLITVVFVSVVLLKVRDKRLENTSRVPEQKKYIWVWFVLVPVAVFLYSFIYAPRKECGLEVDYTPKGEFGSMADEAYYSFSSGPGTLKKFPNKNDTVDYCVSLR